MVLYGQSERKKNQPSIFKSNTYLNDNVYDYVY
jgi:hypothetical protein